MWQLRRTPTLGTILLATLTAGCVVHGGPHRGGSDGYGYGDRGYRHERRHGGYACTPCGHEFGGWAEFRAHLHGVHHIPFWRIPRVIVRVGLDWVYYG